MTEEHSRKESETESGRLSDKEKVAAENRLSEADISDAADAETSFDGISTADADAIASLRDEWGDQFDANLAFAREAVRTVADDDLVGLLEESGLGDDPRIIRAAARIGRALQIGREHAFPSADADERESLEGTLDDLSRRPDYWSERVQDRVRQIYLALHGEGQIPVHRMAGDGGQG